MSNNTRVCAAEGCDIEFVPFPHNQIYHDDACCKKATNARIMEKYHERKARRSGAQRVCKTTGCGALLSRYNDSKICAACAQKDEKQRNDSVLEVLGL